MNVKMFPGKIHTSDISFSFQVESLFLLNNNVCIPKMQPIFLEIWIWIHVLLKILERLTRIKFLHVELF